MAAVRRCGSGADEVIRRLSFGSADSGASSIAAAEQPDAPDVLACTFLAA